MSIPNTAITAALVAEHGLSEDEHARILAILGREPSLSELGVFSAMWSEHCSYKSSRRWLKTLPTAGPQVIQGPGENAGVVDIGGGLAAVFKIESHNHPSFIEPREGAATGVGGILRDVFTMGARPIASLNALRFGDPGHPRTRHLVNGVVAGIGGYGNCIGVPTVGGEVDFHAAYNGNILVNAMTVGVAPSDRIFRAAAAGPGNPVVYVGARTGRDGIHGATMASAGFGEDAAAQRPTVQVGDPFTGKLLLEACLELMAGDGIVAIQDMGAAGLTSASVEMAGRGGLGIALDLDRVPMREAGMTPYEILLSESQERMLMVLRPEAEAEARAVFARWDLDFAVIGRLTGDGRLTARMGGAVAVDIPIAPMVGQAPDYDRPWTPPAAPAVLDPDRVPVETDLIRVLTHLLGSPDLASRRWIWEQYDHLVGGGTMVGPGADAAIVMVPDSAAALAMSVDCTPRYCLADPRAGAAQAVAENWRNLSAVGAQPLAITNNLNFGNPERPAIMGQFVAAIAGMSAACTALGTPVVSGNVSLYNETDGRAIPPTPVIGGVGLLERADRHATPGLKAPGETILAVGRTGGWLGQSLYLREWHGQEAGSPPPVRLDEERRHGDFVRRLIGDGMVSACHDVSDGGLLVALAEMAMAGRGPGAAVSIPETVRADGWAFGEDQGRYLLTCPDPAPVLAAAASAGIAVAAIGRTTGDGRLTVGGNAPISIMSLRRAHESWLPDLMAGRRDGAERARGGKDTVRRAGRHGDAGR